MVESHIREEDKERHDKGRRVDKLEVKVTTKCPACKAMKCYSGCQDFYFARLEEEYRPVIARITRLKRAYIPSDVKQIVQNEDVLQIQRETLFLSALIRSKVPRRSLRNILYKNLCLALEEYTVDKWGKGRWGKVEKSEKRTKTRTARSRKKAYCVYIDDPNLVDIAHPDNGITKTEKRLDNEWLKERLLPLAKATVSIKEWRPIRLVVMEGMTQAECAKTIGISQSEVSKRLSSGLEKLENAPKIQRIYESYFNKRPINEDKADETRSKRGN